MKTVKFVSGKTAFALNLPSLDSKDFFQNFSNFLAFLNYLILFLFVFILPSLIFYDYFGEGSDFGFTSETNIFFYIVFTTIVLLGIHIIRLSIGGFNLAVDPKGFLSILIFSLLITTATLLQATPQLSNTFGINGARITSGTFIIALVGLFYILHALVQDFNSFKKILTALVISIIPFSLLASFHAVDGQSFLVLVILSTLFISLSLYHNKFVLFLTIALSSLTYFIYSGFEEKDALWDYINIFILSAIIPLFIVALTYVFSQKNRLKDLFNKLVKSLKGEISFDLVDFITKFAFLLLPIFVVIYLINLEIQNSFVSSNLNYIFTNLRTGFNFIKPFDNSLKEYQDLIFGVGNSKLSLQSSLLSNILVSQGLLGLSAYVYLWVYGIIYSLNTYIKSLKVNSNHKLLVGHVLIVFTIPVLSLFVYPSIILYFFWLFSFILLHLYNSTYKVVDPVTLEKDGYSEISVFGKIIKDKRFLYLIKFSLTLLVISVIILLLNLISNNL